MTKKVVKKPVKPAKPAKKGTGLGSRPRKLSPKMVKFVNAYLTDLNGAKAAREAGYSVNSAREIASKLLTKPNIQQYINTLREQMLTGYNVTRERITQEYAKLAYFDPRKMYDENGRLKPVHEWGDDEAAAVASVDLESVRTFRTDSKLTGISDEGDLEKEDQNEVVTVIKVKHSDKRAALDSLVKLMGYAAPAKSEITIPPGMVISAINLNIVQPQKDDTDID